jgi:fluoride exporter
VKVLWYVVVGAGLGGAARYGLTIFIQPRVGPGFPVATAIINITGSFVLGLVMRFALQSGGISVEMRALLTTGLCGGFTTFSTFSYETVLLVEDREYTRAGLYVTASVALSLLATFLGFALAHQVLALRARS